MGGSIATKTVQ